MSTRRQHNRLDKVEANASTGEGPSSILVAYAPAWVEDEEAVPPKPDNMESPVWTETDGWVDGAEREIVIRLVPPKRDSADSPEAVAASREEVEAFREAAPEVPFSELTDETLNGLAPDPEAEIPGTSVQWKEATSKQLERIANGETPTEVIP